MGLSMGMDKPIKAQARRPLTKDLSSYYQTTPEMLRRGLQSGVELGRLRRMLYLWIVKSKSDKDRDTYKGVEKCEKETRHWAEVVLKEYKSRMDVDKKFTRLRTDLFLDLSIGKEMDLVDGDKTISGDGRPAKRSLERWERVDEQNAALKLRDVEGAYPTQVTWVTVNVTGEIISQLESQGIFFHGEKYVWTDQA
jgi:hypothetical protein